MNWYSYLDQPLCDPLSDEELLRLYLHKTEENRERLILSGLRAAFKSALMFRFRHHPDFEDILGAAHVALVEAVDEWCPDKAPFFAHILLMMRKAIIKQLRDSFIRIPTASVWKGLKSLQGIEESYTVSELAELLFKSRAEIYTILAAKQATNIRFLASLDGASESMRLNYYCLPVGEHKTACLASIEKIIHLAIEDQLRREMFVKRFGLMGHKVHTKKELAEEYDATIDWVEYNSITCIKDLKNWFDPDFMKEIPCEFCGKPFVPSHCHRGHQRYCSKRCNAAVQAERSRIIQQEKVCGWCNKTFTPKRKSTKFCSSACSIKHSHAVAKKRRESQPKPKVVCSQCGKKFTPKRGDGTGRYGKICVKCYPSYRKEWHKKNKRDKYRLEQRLCLQCAAPVVEGMKYCSAHLDKELFEQHKEEVFTFFADVLKDMACT